MTFTDKVKITAAILFAAFTLKSAHAQNNKNLQTEFKGISITPAALASEQSANGNFSYIAHTLTVNFGLNKDIKILPDVKVSPYLGVSGGLSTGLVDGKGPAQFTKRLTVNAGAGTDVKTAIGPIYIFCDLGLGAMDAQPFTQGNLGGSFTICKINDYTELTAFLTGYFEKFQKTPCAFGAMGGITFVLTGLLQNHK